MGRQNLEMDKCSTYVYLTGQRRTRKLPNACCDTPVPTTAGVIGFDEVEVWNDPRFDRFDWKLVGKKEMFIPYNTDRFNVPIKDDQVLSEHHVNPDYIRWELHRVWVVEATLAKGQRHQVSKSLYYVDEDSWVAALGDRWDSGGRLWKSFYNLPMVMPDVPMVTNLTMGFYDLVSNTWFVMNMMNEGSEQYKIMPRYPDSHFTSEALAGESVR